MSFRGLILMVGFGLTGHALAQDSGGIALGIHANHQHEFGVEGDYFSKLSKDETPPNFSLLKWSLGGSIWQAADKGLDYYVEGGYCRGFSVHGCLSIGYRRQNEDAQYIQTTAEMGAGFLFAVFVRPLFRIHVSDQPRDKNRHKPFDYEAGVKFKWPIATF